MRFKARKLSSIRFKETSIFQYENSFLGAGKIAARVKAPETRVVLPALVQGAAGQLSATCNSAQGPSALLSAVGSGTHVAFTHTNL